jgi:fructokinase
MDGNKSGTQPGPAAIVGVGEILWDLLPGGRQLGGAPFNFTFHCHRLGHAAVPVSRVGDDELGREIRATVRCLGLSDAFLQTDQRHPTGTVTVALDDRGQPAFTITPDVAYDHLGWDDNLESLLGRARAVCFGTLVQRQPAARATVQRILPAARNAIRIYDLNLRQHYYSREVIEASLNASQWVKLNEDELVVLRDLLQLSGASDPATLADLRRRYGVDLAALTRGERGCLVQTAEEEIDIAGRRVRVADTVGAGDAFTAGLLVYTLEGRPLGEAAAFANRLAGHVVASVGGTPLLDRGEVERGDPPA